MKNFRITLFALASALAIISCQDDDVEVTPTDNNVQEEQKPEEQTPEEQTPEENKKPIALNEIKYLGTDYVEIANQSNAAINIGDYFLCTGPGTYKQLKDLNIKNGDLNIPANGFVTVGYDLPDDKAGLGLYSSNSFTSADALVDFVQYGGGSTARENVAVAAGLWEAGDFIPVTDKENYSVIYDGEGNASSDWSNTNTPSFGKANDEGMEIATTTFNVTIRNTVNILKASYFTDDSGANITEGPFGMPGSKIYSKFKAVPGTKLSFTTMNAMSNDHFYAPLATGIDLWESGAAVTGDITDKIYLWDAGTEKSDPATWASASNGETLGVAEPGDSVETGLVRVVKSSVVGDIKVYLAYDAASKEFTLSIENVKGGPGGIVITAGLVVLHAQDAPIFKVGEAARPANGLKEIAEDGKAQVAWNWFNEKAAGSEAFLRLSSSLARFSPALAYAFDAKDGAKDPVFTQGEAAKANSGLEQLAEDGDRSVAYKYIKEELKIPVAMGDKMMPAGPGEEIKFELTVPTNANYRFSFLTMFVPSNDWFLSHNTAGLELFDENGTPLSYDKAGVKTYLYDAGTEADEPVGGGVNQVVSQTGPNVGPADPDTIVRRVPMLMDGQFGKGSISGNGAGVVWNNDPRGGYNLIEIDITPK